jgi:UDP-glucose 4-epimerase
LEQSERGGLDLVVVDDQLARSDHESARKAVSLYLDEVRGEDTLEAWIGKFSVESHIAAHGKKSIVESVHQRAVGFSAVDAQTCDEALQVDRFHSARDGPCGLG